MTTKKKDPYEQIWSGVWWTFDKPFLLSCCDCGLVHDMDIRLEAGNIEIKMDENKKETAKRRRRLKLTVE